MQLQQEPKVKIHKKVISFLKKGTKKICIHTK